MSEELTKFDRFLINCIKVALITGGLWLMVVPIASGLIAYDAYCGAYDIVTGGARVIYGVATDTATDLMFGTFFTAMALGAFIGVWYGIISIWRKLR